jgi:hypothetical protein
MDTQIERNVVIHVNLDCEAKFTFMMRNGDALFFFPLCGWQATSKFSLLASLMIDYTYSLGN